MHQTNICLEGKSEKARQYSFRQYVDVFFLLGHFARGVLDTKTVEKCHLLQETIENFDFCTHLLRHIEGFLVKY